MAGTYLHPTSGYIMDAGVYKKRGVISIDEKNYLRELAKRVKEAANKSVQAEREYNWTEHNDLHSKRPMYICYPEDGWDDLLPLNSMIVKDPFFANYEWYMRHLLYRDQYIMDDFVIKPELICLVKHHVHNRDWGLGKDSLTISSETTSYDWGERPLSSFDRLESLKAPEYEIFEEESKSDFEAVSELFSDILDVDQFIVGTVFGSSTFSCNQPGIAAHLRGVEQILYDMYDFPDELHALLSFITKANVDFLKMIESKGLIRSNTDNFYTDAGGNGYTGSLPKPHRKAKLKDCVGYGVAQEYSEVSPDMHETFGTEYQNQVLELFGWNAYGCCEPYTNKLDILKKIPKLRRISVSPFNDFEKMAEYIKGDYVYSFKPNPALLISDITIDTVRKYLFDVISIAKDCCVEIFLKDIIHLKGEYEKRFLDISKMIGEEIAKVHS